MAESENAGGEAKAGKNRGRGPQPFTMPEEIEQAGKDYAGDKLSPIKKDELLDRLRVSGPPAANAVPAILDCFPNLDTSSQHRVFDFLIDLHKAGADLSNAAELLAHYLTDSNSGIRARASELLAALGDQGVGALDAALEGLANSLLDVRISCARVLGQCGGPRLTEILPRLETLRGKSGLDDQTSTALDEAITQLRRRAAPPPSAEEADKYAPLNGAHILLADDSRLMRAMIKNKLAYYGAVVEEVADGAAALKSLRKAAATDKLPDLAILDIMMPELNGLDLLRMIREAPNLRPLKVLIASAKSGRENVVACAKFGILGYLAKPFRSEDVVEAVRKALVTTVTERPVPAPRPAGPLTTEQTRELRQLLDRAIGVTRKQAQAGATGLEPILNELRQIAGFLDLAVSENSGESK